MAKKSSVPKELAALEKTVGQFMEYWGFKKIHGRIWTHVFTAKEPLDSIELMSRLKVSKGLMSLAIRDLLHYDVIKVSHVGRHGTSYYTGNPDLLGVITNVLRLRERQMLASAREGARALKDIKSLNQKNVQAVVDLTESAEALLSTFLTTENENGTAAIFNPLLMASKGQSR